MVLTFPQYTSGPTFDIANGGTIPNNNILKYTEFTVFYFTFATTLAYTLKVHFFDHLSELSGRKNLIFIEINFQSFTIYICNR